MFPVPQNANQAQAQPHNYIIQPDNINYRRWQQFLVLPSFYFCFISTVLNIFSSPRSQYVWMLNIVVSLFFLVDFVLSSFFVAYWDKIAFAMVQDRRRIFTNNLTTMILDIILIFPFELIATQFEDSHPPSIVYHALRMLALLRFFYSIRINRWFSELEENENINFIVVRIAKMIWVCCLVCHYGGCVFYMMATFHNDVKRTWFSLVDPNFTDEGLIIRYATSIYYAVISFTTVGYGDLHPVSIDEKVFSVIFLLIDFALIAYVATSIVLLVAPDIGPLGKYRARRVRVLGFCRQNGLPDELRDEVSSYLKLEYLSQSQPSEENGILESLPTTIKRKFLIALSNTVTNNNLFKHLSNSIQLQLIQAMEPAFFPANTSIILQNEAPIFLYLVVRGSVDLKFRSGIVKTVRDGEVFGETCVFFNTPQVFNATTREWSRLLMLDRVRLMSILQGSPNDTSHMINAHIQDLSANNNNPYMNVVLDFEKRARIGRIDLPVSLWFAVGREYSMLFDLLIVEKDLDPNGCDNLGRTAMHLAASMGDVDKVNQLFEIGADPNLKDPNGNVPLWNAMLKGHENVVLALEDKGVTLDGCHLGRYACTAVEEGNMNLLQTIGNMGRLYLPNDEGQTALHVAVLQGNFAMIQYLLEMDLAIDRTDVNGDSPYGLASEEIQTFFEENQMLFKQYFD